MQPLRVWDILQGKKTLLPWQNHRTTREAKDKQFDFVPPGPFMRIAVTSLAALLCLTSPAWVTAETQSSPAIIPLSQIHEGMRGKAYTVFEGTKPEPMDVEVLGVLHNVNGPRGDLILVRLHGTKPEYTGVVAGMSGSPVYLDG